MSVAVQRIGELDMIRERQRRGRSFGEMLSGHRMILKWEDVFPPSLIHCGQSEECGGVSLVKGSTAPYC